MVQHYRLHTHGQPSVTADYLTHASLIDDALAQETIGLQSVKPCRFRAASDLELIDLVEPDQSTGSASISQLAQLSWLQITHRRVSRGSIQFLAQ